MLRSWESGSSRRKNPGTAAGILLPRGSRAGGCARSWRLAPGGTHHRHCCLRHSPIAPHWPWIAQGSRLTGVAVPVGGCQPDSHWLGLSPNPQGGTNPADGWGSPRRQRIFNAPGQRGVRCLDDRCETSPHLARHCSKLCRSPSHQLYDSRLRPG